LFVSAGVINGNSSGSRDAGWERFAELVSRINLPVYALGGQSESSLVEARQGGGQGIAAIRAFLD